MPKKNTAHIINTVHTINTDINKVKFPITRKSYGKNFYKVVFSIYLDIHSHILPKIDDGAKDTATSIKLLEMSKDNGITHIIATPHFYPSFDVFDDYINRAKNAYNKLNDEIKGKDLPKIYPGCEILYFVGIGRADGLEQITLNGSRYILIELDYSDMNSLLFDDLECLKSRDFIPVIAHFERCYKENGYRRMIKFVKKNKIPVQINASTVLNKRYKRFIKSILKSDIFCVIATDTHSITNRPPLLRDALKEIKESYGEEYHTKLVNNSQKLYKKIIGENIEKQ